MLAARLVDMRKERDERAKVIKETPVPEPEPEPVLAGDILPDEIVTSPSDAGTSSRSNRSNKKKKKKKKRK